MSDLGAGASGGGGALLSARDVKEIDRRAAELGAPTARLMERAGRATADLADRLRGGGPVAVLCGPGANGGDGFVAARMLADRGAPVRLWATGPSAAGDAAAARAAWERAGGATEALGDAARAPEAVLGAALVIDALFGVGLSRPIEGAAAELIGRLEQAGVPPVLAVDIVSGVSSDTGRALGPALNAAATITFVGPKRGHLLAEGALRTGALHVADIGAPETAVRAALATAPPVFEIAPTDLPGALRKRRPDAHKYDYGHVLVGAGGLGATGAARLAATAALRAGAGLATVAAPTEAMAECAAHLTAVMLEQIGTRAAFSRRLKDPRVNAVVLGPGLSRGKGGSETRTQAFVAAVLDSDACRAGARTAVLDADALTAWSDPEALFRSTTGARAVLTPHPGEFATLFPDLSERLRAPSASFGRIEAARAAAERSGAVVLLKGCDTVVAAPDGAVGIHAAVRDRAAPQLATAGAGDVLAGVIAALAARGAPPFEAACAGAWLHVEAARAAGPALIAEDLPGALRAVLSAKPREG